MRFVTSGLRYIDIDAYASCIAYQELLNKQGIEALFFSSAAQNESINETIKSWNPKRADEVDYSFLDVDKITVLDVSDPKAFDKNVDLSKVDEVIDHHIGHEKYWSNKIGDKAQIEFIGSVCTIIYERWKQAGLFEEMSTYSARLLVCGILDNTLNFKAAITTDRDINAYEQLLKIADLPEEWPSIYFTENQNHMVSDLSFAIHNDSKYVSYKLYEKPIFFGQLTVWDAADILRKYKKDIETICRNKSEDWAINLISISEGKSYIITDNPKVKEFMLNVLNVSFQGSLGVADRLWLRKEIFACDHNKAISK